MVSGCNLPASMLEIHLDTELLSVTLALKVVADVREPHVYRCGRRMNKRALKVFLARPAQGDT